MEPPAQASLAEGLKTEVEADRPAGRQAADGRAGEQAAGRSQFGIAPDTVQTNADRIGSAHGCCRDATRLCLDGASSEIYREGFLAVFGRCCSLV